MNTVQERTPAGVVQEASNLLQQNENRPEQQLADGRKNDVAFQVHDFTAHRCSPALISESIFQKWYQRLTATNHNSQA